MDEDRDRTDFLVETAQTREQMRLVGTGLLSLLHRASLIDNRDKRNKAALEQHTGQDLPSDMGA